MSSFLFKVLVTEGPRDRPEGAWLAVHLGRLADGTLGFGHLGKNTAFLMKGEGLVCALNCMPFCLDFQGPLTDTKARVGKQLRVGISVFARRLQQTSPQLATAPLGCNTGEHLSFVP